MANNLTATAEVIATREGVRSESAGDDKFAASLVTTCPHCGDPEGCYKNGIWPLKGFINHRCHWCKEPFKVILNFTRGGGS